MVHIITATCKGVLFVSNKFKERTYKPTSYIPQPTHLPNFLQPQNMHRSTECGLPMDLFCILKTPYTHTTLTAHSVWIVDPFAIFWTPFSLLYRCPHFRTISDMMLASKISNMMLASRLTAYLIIWPSILAAKSLKAQWSLCGLMETASGSKIQYITLDTIWTSCGKDSNWISYHYLSYPSQSECCWPPCKQRVKKCGI